MAQAAACRNITRRQALRLAQSGRVIGAQRLGRSWIIPEDAKKNLSIDEKKYPRAADFVPDNLGASSYG